jgi:hypothetical protein
MPSVTGVRPEFVHAASEELVLDVVE